MGCAAVTVEMQVKAETRANKRDVVMWSLYRSGAKKTRGQEALLRNTLNTQNENDDVSQRDSQLDSRVVAPDS